MKKEEKQHILEKWRKTGFTDGLKKDGVLEWRLVKSFELLNEYYDKMQKNNDCPKVFLSLLSSASVMLFAGLRRCICGCRGVRVNKIIKPEDYVTFMTSKTFNDIIKNWTDTPMDRKKKRTKRKTEEFGKMVDFARFEEVEGFPAIYIVNNIPEGKKRDFEIFSRFSIDIEAVIIEHLCCMYCEHINNK